MDNSKKLYFFECDDGSLAIEFISKDVRWGLNLEKDLSESGWYYVTHDTLQGDKLPAGLIEALKYHLATAAPSQLCGHPKSSIVSSDEGTAYCKECEEGARVQDLLSLAKRLADYVRMAIEVGGLEPDSPIGIAYRDFIEEFHRRGQC